MFSIKSFISKINIRDYIQKQLKFSIGNVFSVPVGTGLLYVFTNYGHIWYVYSSLLALVVTTLMNFWIQVAFRTIKLEKQKPTDE